MKVTVLGATGGVGRAVVQELADRDHEVTAVSRSVSANDQPPGVRAAPTDLSDRTATAAVVAGSDVIVMAATLPYEQWASGLEPLFSAAVEAASGAGARLVVVDNLYAYGSPGTPITDATPQTATTRKGVMRRELGRRLLAAHADGRARVSIGRFSDYYGPGGDNSIVHQLGIERAVAGKAPRAFIDADQPHTFCYLPDVARGFTALVEQPEADGRSWILPAVPAITQRALLTLVTTQLGLPPKIGRVTPAMLWLAGLANRQLREAREVVAQFDRPYVTRADDFEAAFGPIELTPHDQAIAATLAAVTSGDRSRSSAGPPS